MKILAIILLLIPLSDCKVVTDFTKECPEFFYTVGNVVSSPTVFTDRTDYRQICQKIDQNSGYFFATFYDTKNRIPVYSAYRLDTRKSCKRTDKWLIEPQLDDPQSKTDYMISETSVDQNKRGSFQALNTDYEGSGYDKGHLFPVFHADDQECATATFSLTNAAPQVAKFNRGAWKSTEKKLADRMAAECPKMRVYVVTGVVPGKTFVEVIIPTPKGKIPNPKVKNPSRKVNIPSHYWAAYCCVDQNDKVKGSGGFIGTNEDNKLNTVDEKTVRELESDLGKLYPQSFILFNKSCYSGKRQAPTKKPSCKGNKQCKPG